MRLAWLACLALLSGIEACAALPEIPSGQCGNGVIDEDLGEDCDTFPPPGKDALCRNKGSVHECSIDCSRLGNGTRRPCPQDWGCNLEDICRPQTGRFETRFDAALGNAAQLMSADFDGDFRDDVVSLEPVDTLGRTRLHFHYFSDTGTLEQSIAFPKLLFSPVLAELSGDKNSDVVFSDTRIGLLRGQDRSWVPETFGSYRLPNSRVRMIAAYDRPINYASSVVALTTLSGQPSGFYVPNGPEALVLVGELPGPLEGLMGDPVSGNVLEDTSSSPCLDAVLALRGAARFELVDFCTRNEGGEVIWRSQVQAQTIELSPPAAIDAPAQLVDVDGDGHLDVLLGASGRVYVAHGDGQHLGGATPYRLELANPTQTNPDIPMPLAVGDFTGDGAVDFVFADHLLVSLPAASGAFPRYLPDRVNVGGTWTEARIADLNGNGKLDVVAASRDRPNIDFFNGTGSEHPTLFSLATNGPVRALAIGDFDGDLLNDLAFMEQSASSQRPDSLSVAFGNLAGSPTAPIAIARISGVEQLSVYDEGGLGNVMVASSEREGKLDVGVLTLLEGSGDRSLAAPYALTRFAADSTLRRSTALSLAAGAFTAPGQRDVLTLASLEPAHPPWEFWLVPELYSRSSVPVLLDAQLDEHLMPAHGSDVPGAYSLHINLASTSADLDGKGGDEAVFAMPNDSGGCGLVIVRNQDNEFVAERPVMIDEPCERPELAAVDVDADGALDIALLTGTPGQPNGKLLVLWNGGGTTFDAAWVTRVSPPLDSPVGFTVLPALPATAATPGRPVSFAYVTESAAWLVAASSTPREFEAPTPLDELEHGAGIVAADLNGDGALDLALTDSGTLSVMKAELKAAR